MTNRARTFYGEGAVLGAGQAELFSMMYDMLAADLRRAIDALRGGDVERRTLELIHAQSVLENLQGSLDLEAGGDFARSMDRLFFAIRSKLLEAQWKESATILGEQLEAVETVKAAWQEAVSSAVPASPDPKVDAAVYAGAAEASVSEWRA